MKLVAMFVSFCFVLSVDPTGAQTRTDVALKALRVVTGKVNWDAKTAIVADVTCDRLSDIVMVGYEPGAVWLGVVPGTKSGKAGMATTTRFPVGAHAQDSFCETPVRIETYLMDCDGEDRSMPGCKLIKGCTAFSLNDEACDAFHFHWNRSRKALTWSRR